ncbi:PhzF family phenazine biosynthesis protein [Euzebya sp.]|uniref:PhzF family phenazine biosynthesis protein n=1 Tax=Euzebya sp. TaxID=1971409 RepID=UPI0035135209
MSTLRRLSAFTDDLDGGNPAGVWIGESLPTAAAMQAIAADVGYSETVFATPTTGRQRTVRYFSPKAEVPFCGHATIALGHALADVEGEGDYALDTPAGHVAVTVTRDDDGARVATLTSVAPSHVDADDELVDAALTHLGWSRQDLDPALPPAVAHAGAHHLVLAAATRERLAALDYDVEGLRDLMLDRDLTTVALVHLESPTTIHARNPFPVGGVVEDPATGAAAAALGGLLRARGLVTPPADLVIHQGVDMGRPSTLAVHIPASGGIAVGGRAVELADPDPGTGRAQASGSADTTASASSGP